MPTFRNSLTQAVENSSVVFDIMVNNAGVNEFLKVGTLAHVSCDANGLAAKFADLPLERLGCFRMNHVVNDGGAS